MDKKEELIKKIYTDPAGFGSIENTLKEVRKIGKSITREDVKRWIEINTHRKTNLRGYNSYVSPGPRHEYQVDLFFMCDLKNEEYQDYKLAMCAIDSFANFLIVVPIKSKSESDFLAGLMEAFKNLGGKPKVIYADQEPSWTGRYTQQFLKEKIFY